MRIEPLAAIFSVNIDNLIAVPSGTVGNIFPPFPTGRNINDILFLFSSLSFFYYFFSFSFSLLSFFFSFISFYFILFIFSLSLVEIRRRSADSIIRTGWKHLFCSSCLPYIYIYTCTRIGERSRDNPIKSIIPWGIFHCRNIDESSTETSDSI